MPMSDDPRVAGDNVAVSSLRAGPKEKTLEISSVPRYIDGIVWHEYLTNLLTFLAEINPNILLLQK